MVLIRIDSVKIFSLIAAGAKSSCQKLIMIANEDTLNMINRAQNKSFFEEGRFRIPYS